MKRFKLGWIFIFGLVVLVFPRSALANTSGKFDGTMLTISSAAASSILSGSYPASNAVDGSTSTEWVAGATPASLTADLGSNQSVTGTRWYRVATDRLPKDYTISTSTDNTNFTTQVTVSGNSASGWVWDAFSAAVTARYIKINITATVGAADPDLHEFQVYGAPVIYGTATALNAHLEYDEDNYRVSIYDSSTLIFRRSGKENSNLSSDFCVTPSGQSQTCTILTWSSNSYDSTTSTLTMTTTVTASSINYTVTDKYRFINSTEIENVVTVTTPSTSANLDYSNFFNYDSGTTTSFRSLSQAQEDSSYGGGDNTTGMGFITTVGLSTNSHVYGLVSDSPANTKNLPRWRVRPDILALSVNWSNKIATNDVTSSQSYSQKAWIFRSAQTLADFRTQAITAYATAKSFTGSYFQQMLQVVADSLIHPNYNNDGGYGIRPSYYYGNMFMRDSFWTMMGLPKTSTYNTYEADIMNTFTTLQRSDGRIPTTINTGDSTTGYGTFPSQLDDATLLYIIRSYYNQQNRSLAPNTTAVTSALNYVKTNFASQGVLHDAYGLTDIGGVSAGDKTAYMQGLYAVALLAAQKMGIAAATNIDEANVTYQGMYTNSLRFIPFASSAKYKTSDVLVGEAFSWLLFGQGILSDDKVKNTIDNLWDSGKGLGSMVNSNNTYASLGGYSDGDYWNGGSWFAMDFLAYYAGVKHGYTDYLSKIATRITTETAVNPIGHEYLQTSSALSNYGDSAVARTGYGWNALYLAFLPSLTKPTVSPGDKTNGSAATLTQPTLTFSLNGVESSSVQYQIQIAQDSNFNKLVVDYTGPLSSSTSQSFTVGQAAGSGTYSVGSSGQTLADWAYFMRVRFLDSNSAASSWVTSTSYSFIVDTTAPSAARLDQPADKSTITSLRPTFRWQPPTTADNVSGISHYKLTINSGTNNIWEIDNIWPPNSQGYYDNDQYHVDYDTTTNYISLYTKSSKNWCSACNDGQLKVGKNIWSVTVVDNAGNDVGVSRTVTLSQLVTGVSASVQGNKVTKLTLAENPKITTDAQLENSPPARSRPPAVVVSTEPKFENSGQTLIGGTLNFIQFVFDRFILWTQGVIKT